MDKRVYVERAKDGLNIMPTYGGDVYITRKFVLFTESQIIVGPDITADDLMSVAHDIDDAPEGER